MKNRVVVGTADVSLNSSPLRIFVRRIVFSLWGPLTLFALLLLPVIARTSDGWDEQMDWNLASSFREDWLCGSNDDPSQVRLQMYVGALATRVLHTDNGIMVGRFLAAAYGAVGIAAVWYYGRRRIGGNAGAIAAWILAPSPYYLSFSRLAYTESDMLLCALMPIIAYVGYTFFTTRKVGAGTVMAVLIGVAVATKFTAVAIIPPTLIMLFLVKPDVAHESPKLFHRHYWIPLVCCVMLIATGVVGYNLLAADFSGGLKPAMEGVAQYYSALPRSWKLLHYFSVLGLTLIFCSWGYAKRMERAPLWLAALLVCTLSVAVFFTVAPAHTSNPVIVTSIITRFLNSQTPSFAMMEEHVCLYSMAILFKSSPLIGLALLASPFFQFGSLRKRSALAFPLIIIPFYYMTVLRIDFTQIFYLLPLVPFLAIFTGDVWQRAIELRPRTTKVCTFAAAAVLCFDIGACYPDYNFNGYQYLGQRFICGHTTLGFAGVATIPNDGASVAVRWAIQHAKPGAHIAMYVSPVTVKAAVKDLKADVVIEDGTDWYKGVDLSKVDFVVSQSFYEIKEGLGDDRPTGPIYTYSYYRLCELEKYFTKGLVVRRRFGIEPATVWVRKN